jgi:hypothetical protein
MKDILGVNEMSNKKRTKLSYAIKKHKKDSGKTTAIPLVSELRFENGEFTCVVEDYIDVCDVPLKDNFPIKH